MKNKRTFITQLLIILGVVVLINFLSGTFFLRLDFTQDNRYTLSEATKDILRNLEEPVTVTAYFTEDLPAVYGAVKRDFKDLLIEFSQVSRGNVVYEFVNPNENEQSEMEAMQQGVQPLLINIREKDQVKQQKAYLGALLQYGDRKEAIPFVQQSAAMEYALASSVKKLSVEDKPAVAFIQGHGEPSLRALQQVKSQLDVLYHVTAVTLSDTTEALSGFSTAVILKPTDQYQDWEKTQLDQFLSRGGNLVLALNRVEGNLETMQGFAVETGLEEWLIQKGIVLESDFVVDQRCASVGVRQQQGLFSYTTQMPFHYLPMASVFADHPITKGLENVVFPFASSLSFTGDTTVKFKPLVSSSDHAGTQPTPVYFNIQKKWSKNDFPLSGITLGAAITGITSDGIPLSLVVFSDGDFAVNGEGQQAQQLAGDNVSLLVNSIDWLSDDTGLIALRTKGITSRPIKELEDSTKILLKWINFILPLFLIIVYGFIRRQRKNALRVKRMEVGYVK
ncbi:MAG: Gldg family protein [Bacteroidales bacterium]|nr:Gldg family protein [Bacteroidales bacterium]MDD3960419.1 Gldg family protein [Bacteroidales bacterium]